MSTWNTPGQIIACVCLLVLNPPMSARIPDFSDFDHRARSGGRLSVVFLGGSLTWGAQATDPQLTSYRALTSRRLEDTYPAAHFRFWDAAIGGTGSQLAAFRLERDVLSRKPDLVFLDFTVNDGPYAPDADKLAAYESLVRRLVQAGVPVVQALFAVKKDVAPGAMPRPLDGEHRAIAEAYGVPTGDAVTLMRGRVAGGVTDPEMLWPVPPDVTHPGDEGYALYAEAVWAAFAKAVEEKRAGRSPGPMLNADTYMTVNRARLSGLGTLPAGWTTGKPHRGAVAYDFVMSRWLDDVTIATGADAAPLRLVVRGTNVLLFGESTPLSGNYEVRIDGGEAKTYSAGATNGNMRYFQMIALGLVADREHVIEITPRLGVGQELRIESVCVAGAPAQVFIRF
jgi:lysophospholipase L1-like esterase